MIILVVTEYWVTYSRATSNVWSVRISPPLLSEAGNACWCVYECVMSLSCPTFRVLSVGVWIDLVSYVMLVLHLQDGKHKGRR